MPSAEMIAGWPLLVFLGCFSGLLSGLLGIGGGTILVPALIFGLPLLGFGGSDLPKIAMATSIAIMVPTSLASAQKHASKGAIDARMLLLLGPGLMAGAFFGGMFAYAVDARFLVFAFILFCLFSAWELIHPKQSVNSSSDRKKPGAAGFAGKGLIGGIASALLGIGVGIYAVPLMARYISIQRAVGTAATLAVPMALAGVSGYVFGGASQQCGPHCIGYIYLPAVAAIGISAVLSAPVGAWLTHRLPVLTLRRIFGGFLVLTAFNLTYQSLPEINSATEARRLLATLRSSVKAELPEPAIPPACLGAESKPAFELAARYGPREAFLPLLKSCPDKDDVASALKAMNSKPINIPDSYWHVDPADLRPRTPQWSSPPLPEMARRSARLDSASPWRQAGARQE